MRFLRRVGMGYGRFWKGVIFDREYKNLSDLIEKTKRWFPQFNDGARFKESASELKWVWPTGEELLFRTVKRDSDYWNFHGHEYPFIGWNELTKYPTSSLFDSIMSTNRSSWTYEKDCPKDKYGRFMFTREELPPIPLEVFATTNSYGPGHNWVKRRFIDVAEFGVPVYKRFDVWDAAKGCMVQTVKSQIAIFGSWLENPHLSPEYVATLMAETDPARRAAWLTGSWDIVAGGAFDDLWNRRIHVVPRFVVPRGWRIDRSFDWGSTHPFAVTWFAEANGESATIRVVGSDGRLQNFDFTPTRGSLIQIAELYGSREVGTNKGLKWSAAQIAEKIKAKEEALELAGWIQGPVYAGPADTQIFNTREIDVESIATKFAESGVEWLETHNVKAAGTRKGGFQLMRDRLEASVKGEKPGLYFLDNCRDTLATLPTLPRDPDDPDDIDTDAEDHLYDAIRYRCLYASAPAPNLAGVRFN